MCSKEIEDCILAVRSGDKQAFTGIVETYQRQIYRYVRYIVYDQWDTDDVVQDVFLKMFLSLDQYKPGSNFEAWTYKIAYNHCMSLLKKRSKAPIPVGEVMITKASPDIRDEWMSGEIGQVLKRLKPEDRSILYLRIYKDLSYREISRVLGKNESMLRKKYERAKLRFKKYYEEVCEDEIGRIQATHSTVN